jgi:NADPH2:quinone reductase
VKAVYIREFGGPGNLELREIEDPPAPTGTQVKVLVKAAALNRADLLQRRGAYPPPPGYSPNVPGMEFAGEVAEIGEAVNDFSVGDRVFGITAGEAQAEFLLTEKSILARIPENLSFVAAAAVPEVFITAHDALFTLAGLSGGESVLIHAVGSGVGLAALQLAKAKGAMTIGTSRTTAKLEKCREFGLDIAIDTGSDPTFSSKVMNATGGQGVDVVLDLVGAAFFDENLRSLAAKGSLILVGLTSGRSAEFNLGMALTKRLRIIGTVLRGRSLEEKAQATRLFIDEVVPQLATGKVFPNVDQVFPAAEAALAHEYLESNESFGKVVLEF